MQTLKNGRFCHRYLLSNALRMLTDKRDIHANEAKLLVNHQLSPRNGTWQWNSVHNKY
jgi:hypothetical protein